MRIKKLQAYLFALLIVGAVSCQKEVEDIDLGDDPFNPTPGNPSNPSNNSIIGTWRFVKLIGVSTTNVEMTESGISTRMVSRMVIDSKDESGTLKIDETTMTTDRVKYSASTMLESTMYVAGIAANNFSTPYSFISPETSGSTNYKKITADSVFVESSFVNLDQGGSPVATIPSGAKISWSKDTMILRMRERQTQTIDDAGTPVRLAVEFDFSAKYVK
ncbi:MAG: hypothetical protein ABW007_10145 [Chitinophagaceae bacterium]